MMPRREPRGLGYKVAFILCFEPASQFDETHIARPGNFKNGGVLLNNEKSRPAG
jgi:hypothetical protein